MPTQPAVYSFENEKGKPLYIGKSIHPRSRIQQHLRQSSDIHSKQREFVNEAKWISFYVVDSEIESLLLEARLIRLHQPFYNSIQKDDRSSLFIQVSNDGFPQVRLVRGADLINGKGGYGPFRTKVEAEMVLKVARKVFKFCQSPPKGDQLGRPCFYYHIGQCDGACVGKVSKSEYRMKIGYLKRFLNGKSKGLLLSLERKINRLAKQREYEKAEELKRLYEAVEWATKTRHGLAEFLRDGAVPERAMKELRRLLREHGVESTLERIEGYDVATLQQKNTVGAMVVFFLGTSDKSQYRKFRLDNTAGDTGAMRKMLQRRIRRTDWARPDLILVDGGKPQLSTARKIIPADIPVIALAKREETIVIPSNGGYEEILLPRRSKALGLLQQIRDEAHRFGTGYHKRVRDKQSLG